MPQRLNWLGHRRKPSALRLPCSCSAAASACSRHTPAPAGRLPPCPPGHISPARPPVPACSAYNPPAPARSPARISGSASYAGPDPAAGRCFPAPASALPAPAYSGHRPAGTPSVRSWMRSLPSARQQCPWCPPWRPVPSGHTDTHNFYTAHLSAGRRQTVFAERSVRRAGTARPQRKTCTSPAAAPLYFCVSPAPFPPRPMAHTPAPACAACCTSRPTRPSSHPYP